MLHVLVIKSVSQCFAACNTQFPARRQRSPNASSLYIYLPNCHAVAQDHSPFTAYTNCTEYMCKLHETLALIPIFCMENLKKHLAALFAWPIARAKAIQVLPCSLAVLSPFVLRNNAGAATTEKRRELLRLEAERAYHICSLR